MDCERMTAPCGLACFDCVIHLAAQQPALRERMARQFGVPAEQVGCPGCRDVQGKCPIMTEPCSVFPCVEKRGLKFCGDCSEFPCDHLHPYADRAGELPHNTKVFNLCLIRRMGVEAWAQEKAKSVKATYFRSKLKL